MKRTNYCGLFSEKDVGVEACACGWVETKRDMGGVIFIDLVDREGTLQVVFNPMLTDEATFKLAERVRNQSVLLARGLIALRDEETINPKIATGTVELRVREAELLSPCDNLPFNPADADDVNEELRLRYRFLDLRRPILRNNLRFRHRIVSSIRRFMDDHGFVDVETPMLTKSTPEGARDYLVPSRVHSGSFYALPQSPQIFKQLLMVSGFDRYYQIARCFRDEDLRADRQPEFTQLDLEMSFVEQEDVLALLEELFYHLIRDVMDIELIRPFRRLTWQEAMDTYGSDKPDLRFALPVVDITSYAATSTFTVFKKAVEKGGVVRAITVPGKSDFTRATIEQLTDFAISQGAGGMAWIAWRPEGEVYSILSKFISKEDMDVLLRLVDAKPGDFVLFSADELSVSRRVTGALRLLIGDMLELRDPAKFAFCMITDFPMFEYREEDRRWVAQHHPFTMPYEEDFPYLLSDPARVRSQAYDVVLNGTELGSGSIRIHRSDIQRKVFEALGLEEDEINSRFGFLLNAFRYGAPPHGGFAFGLDRLVMLLAGEDSLRDVIAFPKIRDASCLLTEAPSPVDPAQLSVLGIQLAKGSDAAEAQEKMSSTLKRKTPLINLPELEAQTRLSLTDDEERLVHKRLNYLIDLAENMQKVDTEGVPMTISPSDEKDVFLKPDETPGATRDQLLSNTAETRDGFIVVPPVVE
ncbi:MAG: aspartate--tRNA ligase [Clostridiaceae bacterium]|jgi:aspartyl-tRNA synthetase|nr:aspartate--tRNA ligase [Clostridiaceae bacterium]